ncbi:MAG: sugar phosphate isomerase/epimerase family protein [Candidatus Fimadaptatus sp.]
MKIGVLFRLENDIDAEMSKVASLGLHSCQITCWDMALMTPEKAEEVKRASARHGVEVSTFWCGYRGERIWNFIDGPRTLGIVPEELRAARTEDLIKGSDFARMLGVNQMATHAGFLPECPSDPQYPGVLDSLRAIATRCRENGQYFLFETGQETPTTILRVIEDVGTGNLGVNLDPANLLMYGKANPVDALRIIGRYVRDVHAKDGEYPTCGRELGVEKPLGEGSVNFPALIKGLKECGYDGAITIEREISGEKQLADIKRAIEILSALI